MARIRLHVAAFSLLAAGSALAGASRYVTVLCEKDRAQAWVPAPGQAQVLAGYPDAATDRGQDVCVNIGFLIDSNGKTSSYVELRSWSDASGEKTPSEESIAPFTQIAAAVLARRSFAPVGRKPRPVFTSETFSFTGSGRLEPAAIASHCHIDDLQALVAGEGSGTIPESINQSRYERRMQRGHQCEWFSVYCNLMQDN